MMARRLLPVCVVIFVAAVAPSCAWAAIAGAERKDAYTQHDEIRAKLDFNRRTLAKSYEQVGKRDAKWDEPALEFLDAMGLIFSFSGHNYIYMPGPVPSYPHLEQLGKAALDAGCDDPLVRYCYGAILDDMTKKQQAKPIVAKAADDLSQSKYPPNRISAAHNRAIKHLDVNKDKEEIARRRKEVYASALRSTTGKFEPHDQRVILSHVSDHVGQFELKERQRFYEELRKLPDADPWIVNMVGGDYHIDAAWAWRGGGWAKDVTEEGWRGFNANLKAARDCLARAHELHPEYPEAATLMITVGMGGGDELGVEEREWFDKATRAQVDHLDAYGRYRGALLPRWGGSYRAMHALGVECLRTERYDTLVPYQYLTLVYAVAEDSGRDDIWAHEPTFNEAKVCLTRYAEHSPQHAHEYRSHLAAIAWQAGQYEEGKRQLDLAGAKLDESYFLEFTPLPRLAVEELHAMTGPHGERISAAEELVETDVAAAVKALDAIGAKDLKDPAARYILARRNELDAWRRVEAGEWVTLAADKQLTGWYASGDEWSVDEKGRLVCTYGKTDETFIVRPINFGRGYELRCKVEFDESPRPAPYAGPVVAYAGPRNRYGLYMNPRGQLVVRSGPQYGEIFPAPVKSVNEVRVLVWENGITTEINGAVAKADYRIRRDSPAEGAYLALGAHYSPPGQVVRFSEIRVRRLTEKPGEGKE